MSDPRTQLDQQTRAAEEHCGRLLMGALLSFLLGNTSVDYTMKRYVPQQVNPRWRELATHLADCMQLRQDPWEYLGAVPKTQRQRPL